MNYTDLKAEAQLNYYWALKDNALARLDDLQDQVAILQKEIAEYEAQIEQVNQYLNTEDE